MPDPYATPLANRGPEALQELLVGQRDFARQQVRLLLRSEMFVLIDACSQLADMARAQIEETWPGALERESTSAKPPVLPKSEKEVSGA